jgi:hypothetical protein
MLLLENDVHDGERTIEWTLDPFTDWAIYYLLRMYLCRDHRSTMNNQGRQHARRLRYYGRLWYNHHTVPSSDEQEFLMPFQDTKQGEYRTWWIATSSRSSFGGR